MCMHIRLDARICECWRAHVHAHMCVNVCVCVEAHVSVLPVLQAGCLESGLSPLEVPEGGWPPAMLVSFPGPAAMQGEASWGG